MDYDTISDACSVFHMTQLLFLAFVKDLTFAAQTHFIFSSDHEYVIQQRQILISGLKSEFINFESHIFGYEYLNLNLSLNLNLYLQQN